jgi:hypothetical protein
VVVVVDAAFVVVVVVVIFCRRRPALLAPRGRALTGTAASRSERRCPPHGAAIFGAMLLVLVLVLVLVQEGYSLKVVLIVVRSFVRLHHGSHHLMHGMHGSGRGGWLMVYCRYQTKA